MKFDSEYEFKKFMRLYETIFDVKPTYDDNYGTYYFHNINMKVKSWNNHIEVIHKDSYTNATLFNIIKLFRGIDMGQYMFKEIEKDEKVSESNE